ncbi:hypothetical protein BH11PSE9_BH11PSE9_10590 [soil metagenome]
MFFRSRTSVSRQADQTSPLKATVISSRNHFLFLMRILRIVLVVSLLIAIELPTLAMAQSSATSSASPAEIARLREQQSQLLVQVRAEIARLLELESPSTPAGVVERRKQLESVLNEIERRIAVEENPRTQFIDSTLTTGPFHQYYLRLIRRIEAAAESNYPKRDGIPIYGKGRIRLVVRADGVLEDYEILSSSGIDDIDKHILSLVRGLDPVEPFDDVMRIRADRIVINSKFDFFNDHHVASRPKQTPGCPDWVSAFHALGFPSAASVASLTQGVVTVEFTLNPNGSVSDPAILRSTDSSFDAETLARTKALKCVGSQFATRVRFTIEYRK